MAATTATTEEFLKERSYTEEKNRYSPSTSVARIPGVFECCLFSVDDFIVLTTVNLDEDVSDTSMASPVAAPGCTAGPVDSAGFKVNLFMKRSAGRAFHRERPTLEWGIQAGGTFAGIDDDAASCLE
jgi:hypothetical protein